MVEEFVLTGIRVLAKRVSMWTTAVVRILTKLHGPEVTMKRNRGKYKNSSAEILDLGKQ